ncbi:MAG: ribbon-helix-helix domain-containing protein [Candidatus Aerophobetes bacterium]|nr:ribbon-helix-helix domain-containing protein [Candidatus Aerophobetes bacterium]
MRKAVKVTVSLPRDLLQKVDSITKDSYNSRSSLVKKALELLIDEYIEKNNVKKAKQIYGEISQSNHKLAEEFLSISSETLPQK